jgi:cytochrome c553
MTPIAQALGPTDRHAVARHYAGLPRGPVEVAARHDAALLQEGAALYAAGAAHRGLQACIDCHGPAGRGLGATPALAGQPAAYTAQQLRLWQQGGRANDPDGVMARVARAMTAREIDAVGAYLEGFTSAVRSSRRDPSRDPP